MSEENKTKKKKTRLSKVLYNYLNESVIEEYWHDRNDKEHLYVTVREGKKFSHRLVGSSFNYWVTGIFNSQYNDVLSQTALKDVVALIKAKCMQGSGYRVCSRILNDGDAVYYNLAKETTQEVVKITSVGVTIEKIPKDLKIVTDTQTNEQVMPVSGVGDLEVLRELANCGTREDFLLIVTYLAYCMMGKEPYPVLNVCGEAGSGKSGLCNKLASLIDASESISCSAKTKEEDLMLIAKHKAILYFDNSSFVKWDLSDLLCKIATGAGLVKRKIYSESIHSTKIGSGILLNGVNNVVERSDLNDRCIVINLEKPKKKKYCHELDKKFREVKPQILAGMFNLVSVGMRFMPYVSVPEEKMSRMIDYIRFGTACEQHLGMYDGEFADIMKSREREATSELMEDDIVLQSFIAIASGHIDVASAWSTTPTLLWDNVCKDMDKKYGPYCKLKPASPNSFTRYLNRFKGNLREIERIDVKSKQIAKGKRMVEITRLEEK